MPISTGNLFNWLALIWRRLLAEWDTVQALCAFGAPEIMIMAIQHPYTLVGFAYIEVNGRAVSLLSSKTGSGQEDPLSSISLPYYYQTLQQTSGLLLYRQMYCTEEGVTVGPLPYALNLLISSTQFCPDTMHIQQSMVSTSTSTRLSYCVSIPLAFLVNNCSFLV